MLFPHFTKRSNCFDFLIASLDDETFPELELLSKERMQTVHGPVVQSIQIIRA